LKVLHVIAPGPIAGAERVVIGGIDALRSAGTDARLIVLGDARVPNAARDFTAAALARCIAPLVIWAGGRLDPRAVISLRTTLAAAAPDLLHVHGYRALFYALAAGGPTPLVATHHGVTSHDARVRAYERLTYALYRLPRVRRVFAVSGAGHDELRAQGVPAPRIARVSNFLDLNTPVPAPRPAPEGPISLLFLGRLSPEKGLDLLLSALALPSTPRCRLDIVGDGPERAALERATADAGLAAHVAFHGFQAHVAPFLAAADALVMPSRREGLPMALIEAVAAALPIVAAGVGGIPELVTAGENGELAAPDDAPALAAAIGRLVAAFPARQAAAQARALAARRAYSPIAWADATRAVYEAASRG
jgi:glycosyltransferase involved in cell wall biosynthesis